MDDTEKLIEQITRIANSLEGISETLANMYREGLVVYPDAPTTDN